MNTYFLVLSIIGFIALVVYLKRFTTLQRSEKAITQETINIGALGLVCLVVGIFGYYATNLYENIENISHSTNNNIVKSQKKISYDKLQQLFLQLSFETTMTDIDTYITENNLSYTKQEYNSRPKDVVYRIAYTENDALQRYGGNGDHVSVKFNKQNGEFLLAEYSKFPKSMFAILYNYGDHYDFSEQQPLNKYSGFYYENLTGEDDGIEIVYSNGNRHRTKYHRCSSAEEALLQILE